MATARPGWSRRAQYGLFFSFLAVIAGIVVGADPADRVAGRAQDLRDRARRGARRHRPVAGALHEVTATASGVVTGAGNYWDAANQNAKLKRERQAMLRRMVEAKAIVQENRQLKADASAARARP